jgi:hypothetical protein
MQAIRGFISLAMLFLFVASGYAVTLHVTDDALEGLAALSQGGFRFKSEVQLDMLSDRALLLGGTAGLHGIEIVHDYSRCSGPMCFDCTHVYENVCTRTQKKTCVEVEVGVDKDGKPVIKCDFKVEWVETCRDVSRGHTCTRSN